MNQIHLMHQGCAPLTPMTNKGGGGGGSSTPYYANQDKLFGAQADIATNLYNQYANLAPGYLENSQQMVDQAMDGTLAQQLRQSAGNDAAAANGASWEAMNRNMQRMGAGFSTDRMLSEANRNGIMGAANTAGALNSATQAAEDMKWNRNAGAYGQIAGMGTGAMQGMGSAGSGYGGMANAMSANSAANASGWGKFGASMASGSRWADGGYIEKPGLRLASGGSAQRPAFHNYLTPVDWRNQATSGSAGSSSSSNQLLQGLGMLGTMAALRGGSDLLGDAWRGEKMKDGTYAGGLKDDLKSWWKGGKAPAQTQPAATQDYQYAEDAPSTASADAPFQPYVDMDYDPYPSYGDGSPFANGGPVHKRGLRFAMGGYAAPIAEGSGDVDPWRYRQEGPSGADMVGQMALRQGAMYGAKQLGTAAEGTIKDAFNNGSESFVSSVPETPGVAEVSPVADTMSTGADAAGAASDAASTASTAADAAEGTSSAVPYGSIAKAGLDIVNGRNVGESVVDAAAGYGGAQLGATIGSAAGPVGTVVGGALGGLLGGSIFANGGTVRKNFQPGGKVSGPGTETSDDIPAWLSDGEFVLNAEAVKMIGKDKLEALNKRGLAMRGQGEEAAEGTPKVKDSPAEEKREARGLKKAGGKKPTGKPAQGKGLKLAKGGNVKKGC